MPEPVANGSSVLGLFDQAARVHPGAIAVEAADRSITYRELDERSREIATQLRSLGARPDVFVAIGLGRTVDLAAAVLGVVRSGAAWLPLEPTHPRERLERIVEAARPVAAVADGSVEELLRDNGISSIRADGRDSSAPALRDSEEPPAFPEDRAAYAMFTSGSTGEPKGSVLTHGGLSRYVFEMGRALGVTASDVYLHTASIGFSSSVRQLLVPLCHGARVIVAAAEEIRQPEALFLNAVGRGVTIIDLVPSYWRALMDALDGLELAERTLVRGHRLRLALSASEPLPTELVRRWRSDFGASDRFVNMYGQTETTGIVSLYFLPPDLPAGELVPIGRPIRGMRIEILDDDLHPAPRGAVGEIWIAGTGVARGYLGPGSDTQNAAAFRDWAGPGMKLYRTGDLGRELPDGNFEHHGRTDDQVKIRGIRVELAEVSLGLESEPGVRACAVLAQENEAGVRQLLAWVVLTPGTVLDARELRSRLAARLPEAMIPSVFRFLESLPRTHSGKIDRLALVSLHAPPSASPEPATDRERALAEIWSDVLGVERVGRGDDFFELGGDSITAFRMIGRARASGIHISVAWLFAHPTLADLAASEEGAAGIPVPPVRGTPG
jgi:aspartate racemase